MTDQLHTDLPLTVGITVDPKDGFPNLQYDNNAKVLTVELSKSASLHFNGNTVKNLLMQMGFVQGLPSEDLVNFAKQSLAILKSYYINNYYDDMKEKGMPANELKEKAQLAWENYYEHSDTMIIYREILGIHAPKN